MASTIRAAGITVGFADARVSPARLFHTAHQTRKRIGELREVVRKKNWGDDAASLLLPSEKRFLFESGRLAKELDSATALVVVGIGGSNLGTMAVLQAVGGNYWNAENPARQVFFADTVDSRSLSSIARLVRAKVNAGEEVAINAISKSGGTAETLANFRVLLSELAPFVKRHRENVVVTSDEGSKFQALARGEGFSTLSIPPKVGGRYSVLSNVGLFPLSWAGIDAGALLAGAREMREACLSERTESNPAAVLASLAYRHYREGKRIHDHFLFAPGLEGIGGWYRQLMGESIGKEWNAGHSLRVREGITPTVSIGSTDLHSVGQLFFGGPHDKLFRIVSISPRRGSTPIGRSPGFDKLSANLAGKSLDQIMGAIVGGTREAMRKQGIPFVDVHLPDSKEETVGALLQMEMVEMMLLGNLLFVNPFDQPGVEAYKEETRRLLGETESAGRTRRKKGNKRRKG